MKRLITNSKWRWCTSLVLIALFTVAAFFLANASGRPRSAAAGSTAAQRSALNARAAVAAAPVRAATLPPAAPNYTPGNFTFSTPQALIHPPLSTVSVVKDQDIEPEIKVDLYGTIYVTAIHGYPGGVDLWKSTDKGANFPYLGEPDGTEDKCVALGTCIGGLGGGDDSIDVSSGGYLYVSSLLPNTVTMSASYDGGIGGAVPGQKWEVNPVSSSIPVNDRQWIAAYGPQTVYMTFDQAPVNTTIWFTKSTDAGKTWAAPTMLIPLATLSRENNVAVDQYNGNIYTTYTPSGSPNQLNLLRSTDGGATWTNTTAYTGPAGTCLENAFPIIAVDRGGNLHVVFTQSVGCASRTNAHVYLISSPDAGASWTSPLQIDTGPGNNSTVMPWIVAGSPGIVDVTWYGSSMTSPDGTPANQSQYWAVYFAQVTNALTSNPTIAQSLVANAIHKLPICSRGGNCTGNTRDLAEYYTMTIDRDGNANIAYVDELNYCAAHPASNCLAHTYYTRQTTGPSAYNPPGAPQPATFAINLSVPNSSGTAEPNSWVDSHNCIMGGSIGGPIDFISKDAGLSFTRHSVVVGSGLHGGDFDIKTVPKADGSRPDQIYTADLGVTSVHIGKSTDGGNTYFQPGMSGAAGEVSVSSDRMWLYPDRGVPTAPDQTIYLMDHEFTSEEIRFAALTNDTVWSPFTSGTTASELILPPSGTLPNTNPGPVFVDANSHNVFGVFGASTVTTNSMAPPFGKEPNLWEAVGAAPTAANLPPGPFTNYPAFKGMIDSPAAAPSPAPSIPPGVATIGAHIANIFPSGATDSAGNVYVTWSMNSTRFNTTQANTDPSTTFDIWFASSHDGGKNFYGPWKVSSGIGTSVFPWIAAGDSGRIDICWYQSSSVPPPLVADLMNPGALTGGPNNMPANSTWNVMFAQSLNANSREPVFAITQASDHIIHTGSISNGGTFGSSDRSLLDFFNIAIGPDGLANIFCADNGTSGLHINYMRQSGGQVAKTNPSSVTCPLPPPLPTDVVSHKIHGASFNGDIHLLPPNPGIEMRRNTGADTSGPNQGRDHELIVTFPASVNLSGVTVATNNPSDSPAPSASFSGNSTAVITVDLHNIQNPRRVTITLNGVADSAGHGPGPVTVLMGVLLGDVNQDGFVLSGDYTAVREKSGAPLDNNTFIFDVNVDGFILSGDYTTVRQQSGTQLP